MSFEHEYAILGGWNRAYVGRWIGSAAGVAASATVFLTLGAVNLAKALGWAEIVPPLIMWPLGAGAWYIVMYGIFNQYVWKIKPLAAVLNVPDLSGTWECVGKSLNLDKSIAHEWSGTVTVWQTWDKLKIRLKTPQSGSESISAALLHDPTEGYRLMYHYKNDPRLDQPELKSHRGFAELVFSLDGKSADGEYFNGQGRYTFGTMALNRRTK